MMLQIGDQFDHFQVRAHLAQGGMADIYQAYDLMHGREVVIKIPHPTLIGDPAQYERFRRELEVSNTLQHPAIQHGLGSGQFNRIPYLVTEFVQGESMRDLVEKQAPLSQDDAVTLIRKIADGMAYCHEHDVIHRDLKPDNIIVNTAGQPIIMDFGLALIKKSRRVTYASLTPTAGTPDYMAPEQVQGQRGDQRTDIYALGIMFYELLTGHVPFEGHAPEVLWARRAQGMIPRLDRERPDSSPQVAAVIARCLLRDPEDRYPDMRALIHDLDHLDDVDIAILDRIEAEPQNLPFWKSSYFQGIALGVTVLLVLIILALVGQGMAQ
jgi:serine/threonine-protein kinase